MQGLIQMKHFTGGRAIDYKDDIGDAQQEHGEENILTGVVFEQFIHVFLKQIRNGRKCHRFVTQGVLNHHKLTSGGVRSFPVRVSVRA